MTYQDFENQIFDIPNQSLMKKTFENISEWIFKCTLSQGDRIVMITYDVYENHCWASFFRDRKRILSCEVDPDKIHQIIF